MIRGMILRDVLGLYVAVVVVSVTLGGAVTLIEAPNAHLAVAAAGVVLAGLGVWAATAKGVRTVAAVFIALGVITVTWNGVRIPGGTISDAFFLIGAGLLIPYLLVGRGRPAVPWWLVAAGGVLVLAAALNAMFPAQDSFPPIRTESGAYVRDQLGLPDQPASDTLQLVRLELAMVVLPVVLAMGASHRTRLFSGIWVASSALTALVAVVDWSGLASIGSALTTIAWSGRQAGLSFQPNHLAMVCSMAIPVALVLGLRGRPRYFLALAVLLLGVVASGSRAGVIGAALGAALPFLVIPDMRKHLPIVTLVAVTSALAVRVLLPSDLGPAPDRISAAFRSETSDTIRLEALGEAWSDIRRRPLTGHGFAQVQDAHNIYLQLLEAAGIMGLIALAVFIGGTVNLGWRLREDALALTLLTSVLVWLLVGVVQNQIGERYLYVPVGLLLAQMVHTAQSRSARRVPGAMTAA